MPASTPAGECSECRLPSGNHDSADHQRHDKKFRIRRLHVLADVMWLLGVLLLYICSWPACEFMIPEDRKVVSISEDGRYLATVRSPAKLVKTFSGRVEHKGDQPPQGPIEIWDARGGAMIQSINCGTDIVGAVHLMDHGNLVVVSFHDGTGRNSYISTWNKGTTQTTISRIRGTLHSCADVDGTTIAVVMENFSGAKLIDLRSGKELSQFASGQFQMTALSSDGSRVVTVERGIEDGYQIRVLETGTGNQIGSFLEPNYPKAFTLSPDQETLWIVVADDANFEVSLHGWDIESQQRHTSITPAYKSQSHAILRSAYNLTFLTPSFLQVTAAGHYPALIQVHEESIEIVDADTSGDLFTDDGSLQVSMEYDPAGNELLIVRRMVERGEVFRLATSGLLLGLSPDMRYVAIPKLQTNGLSAFRERLSGLLQSPPQHTPRSAREIHAVDLRDGTSRLVGVMPRHRFKHFVSDGFIDGGKRILINNYIWEFPGHRPWAMILLLPSLLVVAMVWTVKRWRHAEP
ncbi:hypothetical protein Poly51_34650 [Rubripirellula tenax]|uniref:WD40 repeat domain-containing protein n=2 Tax=Rubripirellula tenax TaxID=2528015 RepID=A0A5C6F405_9BACT|nr:hypothetical protein Poly51_34650 [Rubripirellula tenax]